MLYNNKVPMLTIHEKAKSEMGLRNNVFILCHFEFQDLVSTEIEDQPRCHKTDDASHADIRQEMLRKIDTGVGAQGSSRY